MQVRTTSMLGPARGLSSSSVPPPRSGHEGLGAWALLSLCRRLATAVPSLVAFGLAACPPPTPHPMPGQSCCCRLFCFGIWGGEGGLGSAGSLWGGTLPPVPCHPGAHALGLLLHKGKGAWAGLWVSPLPSIFLPPLCPPTPALRCSLKWLQQCWHRAPAPRRQPPFLGPHAGFLAPLQPQLVGHKLGGGTGIGSQGSSWGGLCSFPLSHVWGFHWVQQGGGGCRKEVAEKIGDPLTAFSSWGFLVPPNVSLWCPPSGDLGWGDTFLLKFKASSVVSCQPT